MSKTGTARKQNRYNFEELQQRKMGSFQAHSVQGYQAMSLAIHCTAANGFFTRVQLLLIRSHDNDLFHLQNWGILLLSLLTAKCNGCTIDM